MSEIAEDDVTTRANRAARTKRTRQVMAELLARRAAIAAGLRVPEPVDHSLCPPAAPISQAQRIADNHEFTRLYFSVRLALKTDAAMQFDWCDECGCRHDVTNRQRRLRSVKEMNPEAVRELLGACMWPRTVAGDQMLLRDLRTVFGPATPWSRHDPRDT